MDTSKPLNHKIAVIGWSLLFIWWGVAILVGPITIGLTSVGTGIIMLGVNAARLFSGQPTNRSTTVVGLIALVWGSLDHFLRLSFGVSSAALLIIIGVVSLGFLMVRPAAHGGREGA
jgi:hypothetical protein